MYGPGIGSSEAIGHTQDSGSYDSAAFCLKELGILVNADIGVSLQDKLASSHADAVSSSL